MFELCFKAYKEFFWKNFRADLKNNPRRKVLLAILGILGGATFYMSWVLNGWIFLVTVIILIVFVHCSKYTLTFQKEQQRINVVIKIIKDYQFYSTVGIDGLMAYATEIKIQKSIFNQFKPLKLPITAIISSLSTIIVREASLANVVSFINLFVGFFPFLIPVTLILYVIYFFINSKKEVAEHFLEDLKYIKFKMNNNPNNIII